MFATPFTNMPSQWPPAAPAFAWPGVPPYPPSTQYQHHNSVDMSRGRDASYRPDYDHSNSSSNACGSNQDQPHSGQQPRNPFSRSSHQVNTARKHTQANVGPNPCFIPQNVAQNLYPAALPPRPGPYTASFNPQARSFQPTQSTQRSVNEYRSIPSYRMDKSSRYDTRSRTNAQLLHYNTRAADQVVQSVEAQDTASRARYPTPPWRGSHRRHSTPLRATPARDDPERPVTPPPEPVVSRIYLSRAHTPPQRLPKPQKLLVVLDLNGTLCAREPGNSSQMIKRPGVDGLFEYLFSNHVVMVCTSATRKNANFMVNKLLTAEQRKKLVTIRPRHTFGLTPAQYASKVQIYKNLEDIWSDPIVDNAVPHGEAPWSMANTVLIDDSILKAKAQPHNLIQVPEFEWQMTTGKVSVHKVMKAREERIMRSVQEKLELLRYQANVASLIRSWQEGMKEAPGVVEEKVEQWDQAALKKVVTPIQVDGAENYPTLTSLESTPGQESEEEHEPPEEVELVFRGRQNAAFRNEATEASSEAAKGVSSGRTESKEQQQMQREPSPVTEGDFDWLKSGIRAFEL